MKNLKLSGLLILLFVFTNSPAFSQEITGLKIIENVYNRPVGEDMTADLTMKLINSSGKERIRRIKQFSKDFGDVEKKIMFFVTPADVKNTSFMNWSYDKEGKDDDQWIYLPALKKTKRISSDSKGDYFMGSDFTYDDLGDRKPSDDKHRLLRKEKLDGEECYVVESIPYDENYMYSKTITWVIKDKWIGSKKEFYDEDGELLKILRVKDSQKIDGFWIIVDTEMDNVQKKHRTVMELRNIKIDTGISNSKFTERMMTRGI